MRVELSRGLDEAIELREDRRDALSQLGGRRVGDVIGNQPDQSLEPSDEGWEKLARDLLCSTSVAQDLGDETVDALTSRRDLVPSSHLHVLTDRPRFRLPRRASEVAPIQEVPQPGFDRVDVEYQTGALFQRRRELGRRPVTEQAADVVGQHAHDRHVLTCLVGSQVVEGEQPSTLERV